MDPILKHLNRQRREMLEMLRKFVEAESPSTDKTAVNRFAGLVASELRPLEARLNVNRSNITGNHLEAYLPASSAEFRRPLQKRGILLLGHLDTVWDKNTLSRMPFRIASKRAYGPGIYDMKAGIVIGIFALRCLREMGLPHATPITFLLNADEEIGSPSSRPVTERLARRNSAVLVLEPSYGLGGALKTARKGVGEFRIRVKGKAAHSGLDPRAGVSANIELAHQLLKIQPLTDYSKGITLNPGIIQGGTRSNVVAAEAEAVVDLRVRKQSDARRIERQIRGLRPVDRRARLEISGVLNRPPFERSAETATLFRMAKDLAKPLGIALTEAAVGGGSDGNFTAALGVPTLDGLGAVGDGAHAEHEHVVIDELPKRAALLAHLIFRLSN